MSGLDARLGEEWVRNQFYEYTYDMLVQAWDIEQLKATRGGQSPPLPTLQSSNLLVAGANTGSRVLSRVNTQGLAGGSTSSVGVPPAPPQQQMPGNAAADKRKKRADANRFRVDLIRKTPEFKSIPDSPWAWYFAHSQDVTKGSECDEGGGDFLPPTSGNLLFTQLRKLQYGKDLDTLEVEAIFSVLESSVTNEESMQALLTVLMDESLGGLNTIAVGLLHPNKSVKNSAATLLKRMQSFPSTEPAFKTLNKFFVGTLARQQDISSARKGQRFI